MKLHHLTILVLLFSMLPAVPLKGFGTAKVVETPEKEKTVSLGEVPDAVKATMLAEILNDVKNLKLKEIELETKDGIKVYEAEFEYEGIEIELLISASGKLLAKEVEGEDETEDENDDDEDTDEDE
ncbi:MAG: hypothetical protein V3U24_06795 [Candidatus Neomarinimicrobiota bacterium]